MVILGLGLPSIIIGTVLIFVNKNLHEAPHFVTWHAVSIFSDRYDVRFLSASILADFRLDRCRLDGASDATRRIECMVRRACFRRRNESEKRVEIPPVRKFFDRLET